MTLYINTKDQNLVTVSLKGKDQVVESLSKKNEYGSQVLLPLIMKLLKLFEPEPQSRRPTTYNSSSLSGSTELTVEALRAEGLKTLKGIEVETGPGSFTGLRVGVSVANALGFALKIPVNGKKIETDLRY